MKMIARIPNKGKQHDKSEQLNLVTSNVKQLCQTESEEETNRRKAEMDVSRETKTKLECRKYQKLFNITL